ncbi:MAG TPA: hypothetical protein VIC04_02445 [Terriglobia bacterium]
MRAERAADGSDLVFLGVVESPYGEEGQPDNDDLVTFRVERMYKGPDAQRIGVHSGIGRRWMSSCGYHFSDGVRYVVFARKFENSYHVGACSTTTPIQRAAGILRFLNGEPPDPEDLLPFGAHMERAWTRTTGSICGTLRRADGGPLDLVNLQTIDPEGEVDSYPGVLADLNEETGSFCVSRMKPGSYAVTAVVEDQETHERWVGMHATAAPSGKSVPMVVAAGDRIMGADILAAPQPTFSVDGFLETEDGSPVDYKDEFLTFYSEGRNPFPVRRTIEVQPNGYFLARGLPAGKYSVSCYVSIDDTSGWRADAEVEVKGHHNGLRLVLRREKDDP